ncbi:hypothetical protein JTE90_009811, partial [Oedothorax gibbosus]
MRLPGKAKSENAAFVAKTQKSTQPPKGVKQERRCFKCNQLGHIAKHCWKRNAVKSSDGPVSKHTREGNAFMCSIPGVAEEDVWLADSGASAHMTRHKEYFSSFESFTPPKEVQVGNNSTILAYGQGVIDVKMKIGGQWIKNYLTNVWYVPEVGRNLFSISETISKGYKFEADMKGCWFTRHEKVQLVGKPTTKGLYALEMCVIVPEVAAEIYVASSEESAQVWHERLCHQNKWHVQKTLKKFGVSLNITDELCAGCLYGKHSRSSFGTRQNRPTVAGGLIHADVCGPMQESSIGGARYFLCFKDDYSKFRRVFFLEHKNEVSNCLQVFLKESSNAGITVKELLTDGGTEFKNSEVQKILESWGITHRVSMPYSPEQNGSAERENRTIVECSRSLIHSKELPLRLWAEAVNTVVYVLNRTGPTTVEGKAPVELWFGKEITAIDHLRIFGTDCFVHVPKQRRKKWDKKSTEGLFVGYCGDKDGYRVWIPSQNKVILSRDVVFRKEQPLEKIVLLSVQQVTNNGSSHEGTSVSTDVLQDADETEEEESPESVVSKPQEEDETEEDESSEPVVSKRKVKLPEYLKDFVLLAACDVPDSYHSAMSSDDAENW